MRIYILLSLAEGKQNRQTNSERRLNVSLTLLINLEVICVIV